MTDHELFQQALNSLDMMTRTIRRPSHVEKAVEVVIALRARLAQSDWVRVEDALPVIPDGARNVAIWEFGGQYSLRPMRSDYDYEGFWPEDGITHWRYAEPTPNPPEQKP